MKKIFYSFLFLFFFLVLPCSFKAASLEISSNSSNLAPNKNIVITINAKDFTTKFGSIHFDLKFDASKFSYSSSKALQGELTEEKKDGVISITIDNESGMDNGKLYQITLLSSNTATTGSSNIVVDATNDCFDENLTMINVTGTTLTINHYLASATDTLSNLSVSNCELSPKFNPDTLNYSCKETTVGEVTVTGSVTDSKAKVIGLGVNKLEYGNNNLSVIVIAENGNKKKYNINILRKDVRNENNFLEHLEVVGYSLNFEPSILEYNLEVASNVEKITINGTTRESTSVIKGLGEMELKSDYNSFYVTVEAASGATKVYRINVIKKEENMALNTLLLSLSFNDIPIKLTEKRTYLIGIPSNINVLDLKYETSSNGVSCEVIGNENLKEGINVVEIIIKASNISDTKYTLLVYKESNATEINDFSSIKEINDNYFYNEKNYNNIKIPKSFFDLILNSNYYFNYNIVNEYGGLLASFKFTQNSNVDDDLEILFSQTNSKNLSYSSNIPSGVLIKLYLDTEKSLKIYNNNNGDYELIDTVTPVNGYIEFVSNGSDNYIFSENELFNELKKSELTVIRIIFIFIAGIVIGTILHYYLGNNKRQKINLEITKL